VIFVAETSNGGVSFVAETPTRHLIIVKLGHNVSRAGANVVL
jgi:hypothetical protein